MPKKKRARAKDCDGEPPPSSSRRGPVTRMTRDSPFPPYTHEEKEHMCALRELKKQHKVCRYHTQDDHKGLSLPQGPIEVVEDAPICEEYRATEEDITTSARKFGATDAQLEVILTEQDWSMRFNPETCLYDLLPSLDEAMEDFVEYLKSEGI